MDKEDVDASDGRCGHEHPTDAFESSPILATDESSRNHVRDADRGRRYKAEEGTSGRIDKKDQEKREREGKGCE